MAYNPFQPPASVVTDVVRPTQVAEPVRRDIRNAWIAATISGCVTLVFAAIATLSSPVFGFGAAQFIDVALIFGLGYGVYRCSRACAVGLLAYFVLSKLIMLRAGGPASGIPMALLFIYFYSRGVVGTFRYHRAARA
ncbi:MAG TPA: hypothetical protein VEG36_05240 [Burkholderiales bacterium]|nr:hypothetical protein [Burkholderiales bacterium]